MNLATLSHTGAISSRMVLLKEFDESGFVFFTNYNSDKAQDLHATRIAALCFWWDKLYRQVRISGRVERSALRLTEFPFTSRGSPCAGFPERPGD